MTTLDQNANLISETECLQIIRQNTHLENLELIEYTIENAASDVLGFLGEYFRLKITLRNETDELIHKYYFVKSLPIKNTERREMIIRCGLFRKEVVAYQKIFPNMKGESGDSKWHPRCFLVRDDILIFEELHHLGFLHVPDRVEFDEDHMMAAIKCLALMHAASIDYEKNVLKGKKISEIHPEIFYETLSTENTWLMAGMRATMAIALNHPIYGAKYKDKIESNIRDIQYKIFELLTESQRYHNVLSHRDLWVNNLMFKYLNSNHTKPECCILIDFQIIRYNPPSLDFMIMTYFNTRRKNRDQAFNRYQNSYYDQLSSALEQFKIDVNEIFPKNDFMESCELFRIVPLVLSSVYVQLTHLPAGYLNNLKKNETERYNYICDVDRTDFVLETMEKDQYYCDFLNEAVGELIERYIIRSDCSG